MRSRNSLSFKALSLARNSREFDVGFAFALNVANARPQKRRAIKNTIKTCRRDAAFACASQQVFRANAQYSPRLFPLKRLRICSRPTRRQRNGVRAISPQALMRTCTSDAANVRDYRSSNVYATPSVQLRER